MRRLSVAAALLGAVCFLALPLTGAAGAGQDALPIYHSIATGQGVVATAAIRPSIFESAGQAGALYADATISSQGGGFSNTFAAPGFPGKFVTGALTGPVGCGGLKGWVEALWPPADNCASAQEDSFAKVGLPHLSSGTGEMAVTAALGAGTSHLATQNVVVRPAAGEPPILRIGAVTIDIDGARLGDTLQHVSEVTAKNIRLLDDAVVIRSLVSRAVTLTNGEISFAEATLTFGRVLVTVNGTTHDATVTSRGVHVNDPPLSRDVNTGLTETVEDELLRAGISISATSPSEITEGGSAEASVGGLVFSFHATIPSVPVPQEAAPTIGDVLQQIPTKCVRELTHEDRPDQLAPLTDQAPELPLCFGAGALPGGGSEPVMTLTVASASSGVVGATLPDFGNGVLPGPGDIPCCDVGSPPVQPVGSGPPGVAPVGAGAVQPQAPVSQGPPATLVGLISNLPDAALAIAGSVLTILAFGFSAWPSLRHARAR